MYVAAGIAALIVVLALLYAFSGGSSPPSTPIPRGGKAAAKTTKSTHTLTKEERLQNAHIKCRSQCIKEMKKTCGDICKDQMKVLPKPKVGDACVETCTVVANKICVEQTEKNPNKSHAPTRAFTLVGPTVQSTAKSTQRLSLQSPVDTLVRRRRLSFATTLCAASRARWREIRHQRTKT